MSNISSWNIKCVEVDNLGYKVIDSCMVQCVKVDILYCICVKTLVVDVWKPCLSLQVVLITKDITIYINF